jgi:hypothetical protein
MKIIEIWWDSPTGSDKFALENCENNLWSTNELRVEIYAMRHTVSLLHARTRTRTHWLLICQFLHKIRWRHVCKSSAWVAVIYAPGGFTCGVDIMCSRTAASWF